MENKTNRKPGPAPGIATERYQVLLEEDVAEWAKHQPEGLSKMLRRILRQEYNQNKLKK